MNKKLHEKRRLLILGINKLLEKDCISLDFLKDDIIPENVRGHLQANIGGFESIIYWRKIGHEEISVFIWWNYDHSKNFRAKDENGRVEFSAMVDKPFGGKKDYKKYLGALISGDLERKTGKYLQGCNAEGLRGLYIRKDMREVLKNLKTPISEGYDPEGKSHDFGFLKKYHPNKYE